MYVTSYLGNCDYVILHVLIYYQFDLLESKTQYYIFMICNFTTASTVISLESYSIFSRKHTLWRLSKATVCRISVILLSLMLFDF